MASLPGEGLSDPGTLAVVVCSALAGAGVRLLARLMHAVLGRHVQMQEASIETYRDACTSPGTSVNPQEESLRLKWHN